MSKPLDFYVAATIKSTSLAKRPGTMRDGRRVMSLLVSINDVDYELNIVTKPNQPIEAAVDELVKLGIILKDKNEFVILVPTWSLAKAKNNVVWVHVEDYERLKGTTT
jgi:hypothetical protein